jgi:putative DNA primase/helicase
MNRADELCKRAMQWAAIGVHVLPCRADKRPAIDPETGKPFAWGEKASTDEEAIAEMPWGQADYIGLYLGKSGKVAVDVDWLYDAGPDGEKIYRPKDDPEALEHWERAIETLDALGIEVFGTMSQKTQHNGRHRIFQGNGRNIDLKPGWLPKVDLKGGVSYILDYGGFNISDPFPEWPYPETPEKEKPAPTKSAGLFPAGQIPIGERGDSLMSYLGKTALFTTRQEQIWLAKGFRDAFFEQPESFTDAEIELRAGSTGAWTDPAAAGRFHGLESELDMAELSDITPEPIDWLWQGHLAKGKIHIIGGKPGEGKTTIALSMAAEVSRGGTWPDGSQVAAGDAIVWSGEDGIADTIAPRLLAMGADKGRTHIIRGVGSGDVKRSFDPAHDVPLLAQHLRNLERARLLVVDPLMSAVKGDAHRSNEVRRDMQPLVDLAERYGLAVLGVHHLTKGTQGGDPVERISGSIAFGALTRVLFVTMRERGTDRRMFMRAKSNIGPDDNGFLYDLSRVEVASGIQGQRVDWGAVVVGSARDIMKSAEMEPEVRSAKESVQDDIEQLLAAGPMGGTELNEKLVKLGHKLGTINVARAEMKLGKVIGANGKWRVFIEDRKLPHP